MIKKNELKKYWRTVKSLLIGLVQKNHDKPVFIIANARTGSSLLCDIINQQENVQYLGEILGQHVDPILYEIPNSLSRNFAKPILRNQFRQRQENETVMGKVIFGWFEQLNLPITTLPKLFPDARFIILYRKSLIDMYISQAVATKSGQWKSLAESSNNNIFPLTLDKEKMLDYFAVVHKRYSDVISCKDIMQNAILVEYEEFSASPEDLMQNEICPFLNLKYLSSDTLLKKQAKKDNADMISNYEELLPSIEKASLSYNSLFKRK